jgi:hypothetical protein
LKNALRSNGQENKEGGNRKIRRTGGVGEALSIRVLLLLVSKNDSQLEISR